MAIAPKIDRAIYSTILELMPILCVDTVIEHQGKVLLVKRKNAPAKDQWWFPGGRLFKGETIAEAAVRKAREETGLACSFKGIRGIEETYFAKEEDGMLFDIHTVNVTTDLELVAGDTLVLDDDHSDTAWIEYNSTGYHESIQNILRQRGFQYQ